VIVRRFGTGGAVESSIVKRSMAFGGGESALLKMFANRHRRRPQKLFA
jgi:hypothetical protein